MDPMIIIVVISVLGPVIGSAVGVLRRPSFPYICNMLCFAAGVMLAISFLDLIPESIELASTGLCIIGLVFGAVVMYGLDRLIPHIHPELCSQERGCNLKRTSFYLILCRKQLPDYFLPHRRNCLRGAVGADFARSLR